MFPQKRMDLRGADEESRRKGIGNRVECGSRDLAAFVDEVGIAFVSAERAEIENVAVLPSCGMNFRVSSERVEISIRRESRDRTAAVDSLAATAGASGKNTEVMETSIARPESVLNVRVIADPRVYVWVSGSGLAVSALLVTKVFR